MATATLYASWILGWKFSDIRWTTKECMLLYIIPFPPILFDLYVLYDKYDLYGATPLSQQLRIQWKPLIMMGTPQNDDN